jgi:hypothetical protein
MTRIALPFVTAIAAFLLAVPGDGQNAAPAAELKPTRAVTNGVLTSASDPAVRIRVDPAFKHIGAQRFILRNVADAEQHVFVDAAGDRVTRMYWIQFEKYLPGRGGTYAYESDAALTAWGLPLRSHVRRFAEPPVPDSDRQRVHDLIARAGLTVPSPSVRARLVYLPTDDRRQELMIIYLEAAGAAEPTDVEAGALIQRALAGLELVR